MTDIYINVQNLTFKYDNDERYILKDVSLNVKKGEFVVILGHNGCGKSTLARQFNAMLLPCGGRVFVSGIDTLLCDNFYEIRQKVGLVLQNPDNQIVASLVKEDVAFAPENLGVEPGKIEERVDAALKAVDMYEYKDALTYQLSGGQKQRIAIAGIIAMNPECIVLDESTAMLDPQGRKEVMDTIKKLKEENGITVILITHYMDEAVDADKVFVMEEGKIIFEGTPKEVFSNVDFMKKHSLSVPQSTELVYLLKKAGYNVKSDVITIDECINVLQKLLEEKGCL